MLRLGGGCTIGRLRGKGRTSPALAAHSCDDPGCFLITWLSSCHSSMDSLVSLTFPVVPGVAGVCWSLAGCCSASSAFQEAPQGRAGRFDRRNPTGFSKNEARRCAWT